MNGVRFKDGVLPINTLAPAGVRILGALDITARRVKHDLVVTCADKEHSASDPHSLGEAFDVRTHDLADDDMKRTVLRELMLELQDDPELDTLEQTSGGLATRRFFGWIEHPNEPNEHLHVQRRRGTTYTEKEVKA